MLIHALFDARRRHAAGGWGFVLLGPLQPAVSRLPTVSGPLEQFTIASTGSAPNSRTAGTP